MLYFTHLSRYVRIWLPWRRWHCLWRRWHCLWRIWHSNANVISVTQNRDGYDRDGYDGTSCFLIITLNVDDSWCPFWCIWTNKHVILQLPWFLTNNNTVLYEWNTVRRWRWIKVRTCHSEIWYRFLRFVFHTNAMKLTSVL